MKAINYAIWGIGFVAAGVTSMICTVKGHPALGYSLALAEGIGLGIVNGIIAVRNKRKEVEEANKLYWLHILECANKRED